MQDLEVKVYNKLVEKGIVGTSLKYIEELINIVDAHRKEQLRINDVVASLPNIDSNKFKEWLKDEGYQRTNIKNHLKRNNAIYNIENIYKHYRNVIEFC